MCDERSAWSAVEMWCELGPRVVLSGHFGERSDREAARQVVGVVEHDGHELSGTEQCQAVLGQRRCGPDLTAGLDGAAGTVARPQQTLPIARRGAVVDQPDEPVEVAPVDQLVEVVVGGVHRRAARAASSWGPDAG